MGQSKVGMNTVQMANMSTFVNATGNQANRPSGPTYSPTPIQRPHIGQGKPMNEDDSMGENGPMKDKKSNDANKKNNIFDCCVQKPLLFYNHGTFRKRFV